jgi:hypothetical protein
MTEQLTLPPAAEVTGPGVYAIPAEQYHGDPVPGGSLSSTGARKLLPPSCPALFHHWRSQPAEVNDAFDLGHAAHALVLGTGPELVLVDRPRWDTNAVKQEVADIRERGAVPLKREPYDAVHAMAEQIRRHPIAGRLLDPGNGVTEQALIWAERTFTVNPDPAAEGETRTAAVRCRAMVDLLPHPRSGRMILPDYKTAVSAHPDDVAKALSRHGYHIQLGFYLRGARALGLADDTAVGVLVVQEKTPPYLVSVIEPDRTARRLADMRVQEAIDTYAQCTATGRWPGYSDDVVVVELPRWETRELDGEIW